MANPILSGVQAALNNAGTPLPSDGGGGGGSGGGGASKRLIGNWGIYIIFRVGTEEALTFRNARKRVGARYAEHNLIGNVPRLEWLGKELIELTMEILLSTDLGIHVPNTIKTIEKAAEFGIANELWIGNKKVGTNKFIISSVDEDWQRYYSDGQVTHAVATLTFREYYEGVKK